MFNAGIDEALLPEVLLPDAVLESEPLFASEDEGSAADSHRAAGYVDRGLLLFADGHSAIAAGMFRQAIALNPHDALAHYVLGIALKAMGRNQEAVREWEAALGAGAAGKSGEWAKSRAQHLLKILAAEESREEKVQAGLAVSLPA